MHHHPDQSASVAGARRTSPPRLSSSYKSRELTVTSISTSSRAASSEQASELVNRESLYDSYHLETGLGRSLEYIQYVPLSRLCRRNAMEFTAIIF